MKVYGPYTRKDGRQVVIVHANGTKKTVSYPKFLVESQIGRLLNDNETIDHIDGDFTNNDFNNLRIVDRAVHCADDVIRRKTITMNCVWCGAEFTGDWKSRKRKKAGPFCSRTCSGKYGASIQNGGNKKETFDFDPVYYKHKEMKHIEPNIGNSVSGLGDFGETLTDNADGNTEGTVEIQSAVETRYPGT